MQSEFPNRAYLPSIPAGKVPSISTVFNLIKMRKKELTRNIDTVQESSKFGESKPRSREAIVNSSNFEGPMPDFDQLRKLSDNPSSEAKMSRVQFQRNPIYSSYQGSFDQGELLRETQEGEEHRPISRIVSQQEDEIGVREAELINVNGTVNGSANVNRTSHVYSRGNHRVVFPSRLNTQQGVQSRANRNNKTESIESWEPRKIDNQSQAGISMPKRRLQEQFQIVNSEAIQRNAKEFFLTLFHSVPRSFKHRNEENLSEIIKCLETFNPFFNRVERVINVCIMKMGHLVYKEPHTLLYKANDKLLHFYIILLGKVRLSIGQEGQIEKRMCCTGETVLEQMLMNEKPKKGALQKCKTVCGTFLLEVRIEEYLKIREELIRFGYKVGLTQLESIIKRNYIVKNWIRNKHRDGKN